MTAIFFLIDQLAVGLYVLLGGFIVLRGWRFLQANKELRESYFELERDLARQRQVGAVTSIIISAELVLLVLGVQQSVVPFLEQAENLEQIRSEQVVIEDQPFYTDTPPAVAQSGLNLGEDVQFEDNDESGFDITPTPTNTPVGTIVPNPPPIQGCESDQASLQIPANGMRVFQPMQVRGTAFTDNFSQAKIEISGPTTQGSWATIDTIDQPVRSPGDFSQFVPSIYEEGRYEFRIAVFDITDTLVASCMVNIFISSPPRTPTPTPTPQPQQ